MSRRTKLMIAAAAVLLAAFQVSLFGALGHGTADWIQKGGYKNAANEWCCGEVDCFAIPARAVKETAAGYEIGAATATADGEAVRLIETVPYSETLPSQDGQFWRCKRPDGSRRCFFAPPQGS